MVQGFVHVHIARLPDLHAAMSDSEDLEQPAKKPRTYMGPSASHKAEEELTVLPPGHSYLCAQCSRTLGKKSDGGPGINSLPLVANKDDLKNMGLPVFIPYQAVWPGTYCCCISMCDDCLECFYQECSEAVTDLTSKGDARKEAQAAQTEMASSSSGLAAYEDYHKAPSGIEDFPTKQHVALVRTVLVQMREAAFSIMCNWQSRTGN